jgi:hypothetical protein
MGNTPQVTFDPDAFMASRKTAAPASFDTDSFMANRQPASSGPSLLQKVLPGLAATPESTSQQIAQSDISAEAARNAPTWQKALDVGSIVLPSLFGKAVEALPSAERAGQAFQGLSKAIGSHPVAITDELSESLTSLRAANTTTNTNIPAVVQKLIGRVDPLQGLGPLTYDEARSFSSEINQLSAADKMSLSPNTKRLIGNLNQALKGAVQDTADLAGKGDQLSQAMSEYHHAMQIRGVTDAVKAELWKAVLTGAGIYGAKKIWDAAGTQGKP